MNEDINLKANQDKDLESKPTLEKVLMLQRLLSELNIRKNFLKSTKEKILSEVDKNCYKYFHGKVNNKRYFK